MRPLLLALVLAVPAFRSAPAAILRPDTPCSTIVEIMDGADHQQIGYAV